MRILLVEDDETVSAALEKILSDHHYTVDVAIDGQVGWELVEAFTYDLIMLDVVLPKQDGIWFCQQLRAKNYQMPILLLTAQNSASDKVSGLDAGADDYVVKPFEAPELLARIRALLRRGGSAQVTVLEWEKLRLDPGICEVTYHNHVLHLTPKEYRLLELFLRNHHRVFSRSAILDHLWSCEEAPREDTVTVHIKALRQKLKQAGAPSDIVETVYGQGYRLKQLKSPVESVAVQESDSMVLQQTKERLAIVWEKYRGLSCDRLKALEYATAAWLESKLKEDQQQKARQVAHKLAGALGIFGFAAGSQYAREIEEIFQSGGILDSTRALYLSNLLSALRKLLEQTTIEFQPQTELPGDPDRPIPEFSSFNNGQLKQKFSNQNVQPTPNGHSSYRPFVYSDPLLLVVDENQELAEAIVRLARMQAIKIELVSDPATISPLLHQSECNIVVLHCSLSSATEASLHPLLELANQTPPLPVLFLSENDNVLNRVKVAQVAVHSFLPKTLPAEQILAIALNARSHTQAAIAKVMIVDDDLQLLGVMRTLLEPLGLQLTTLAEPLQFWQTLETVAPDLLVLDVQMPHLNGIDLCQILRHSPRWSHLPVLFLTAHTDPYTIEQIFAAGADDCVGKAIGQPELLTRLLNRLESTQLLQSVAEVINVQSAVLSSG